MAPWQKWLPCLGTFLASVIIFGVHNNFGLLFHHLTIEFNENAAETAWIGSFAMGITFLLSPLSNIFLMRMGFIYTIIAGTILCMVSLFTSSYVYNIHLLSFTYSVLWGSGSSLINQAGYVIIQEHYKENLSLANGIASSGTGVGTLIIGPILELLLRIYAFRWTFRICSALPLTFLLLILFKRINSCALKVTPLSTESSKKEVKANDDSNPVTGTDNPAFASEFNRNTDVKMELEKSTKRMTGFKSLFMRELWSNKAYTMFVIGASIFLFGYFIPFVFLVDQAIKLNISEGKAQLLLSILSIVSTVTKITCGYVLDAQKRVRISTLVLASMYILSLCHLCASFATKYWHLCAYSIIFGLCEGCFVGQLCALLTDIVPQADLVGTAIGNFYAFMSVALMTGPVVAGKLVSIFHSYQVPFIATSGISLFGTIIATLLKIFERKLLKIDSNHTEENTEC